MPLSNTFPQSIADVLVNQTLTTSGSSQIFDQFTVEKEITIVVTVAGPVTGTTPTLQFTMWNLDQTNAVFASATSSTFTTSTTASTFLFTIKSSRAQLNWTVGGSSPSFGGVYVSFISSNAFTTQAISGTLAATQGTSPWVISGSVTANAGTNLNTSLLALDSTLTGGTQKTKIVDTGGTNVASVSAAGAVKVDGSAVTQPVSGTVTSNQGTSPWVNNITQFGSTNVSTGTGASGAGIPRVTISNDSSLAANQSVNVNQVGGSAVTLGQKTTANSIPVTLPSDQTVSAAPADILFSQNNQLFTAPLQITPGILTESPILLVRNPAANTLDVFLEKLTMTITSTNAPTIVFRLYLNPTITTNGTTITPRNKFHKASPVAATALVTSSPTISVNGTLLYTWTVDANSNYIYEHNFCFGEIFDQAQSCLLTAQVSLAAGAVSTTLEWREA